MASAPPVSSGTVQRNSLPPVSSAPLGAPVAAASTQMRNQVDQAQDMAASRVNNTVNAAETRVASAATVTHNTVNGAKEKVLGQLPATGQGAPRPMDNNIAGVPQAPAVNGKKSSPTNMASAGGAIATPPSVGGAYVVKSGDSLFSIAKKHNVPVDQLKAANGLTSGAIRVGQPLVIPSAAAGAPTHVAVITPQPANPVKAASAPANGGAQVKALYAVGGLSTR